MIKELGKGGMGHVYLVKDNKLGMNWAVKEIGDSTQYLNYARKSEVSVLRKVSHPNLPRVTDIFDERQKTYMVMDYIEGRTLQEILSAGKKIPPKNFYRWSLEITSALSYLHSMNPPVIYRDLKPSNIIIKPSGDAVLIDFGTAKKFDEKSDEFALGTKRYASPEQFRGKSDKRSDIYSLGRVLKDMSGNDAGFLLEHIIKKCCRKDPEKRYPGAEQVRRSLVMARDFYKYACVLMIVMTLSITGVVLSSQNAEDSVRQIEEINENERMKSSYEDGLMCFYELKDYSAALEYFGRVDEKLIPEAGYYINMCTALSRPGAKKEDLFAVLEDFREFNEKTLKKSEPLRKAKNDLNIAGLCLAYFDNDLKKLEMAEEILKKTDISYETVRIRALIILESVYRQKAAIGSDEQSLKLAIQCNKDLIELDPQGEGSDFLPKRYLSNARMYEQLKDYKKAGECYRISKEKYPGECAEIYLGHLRLLISCRAPAEDVQKACREAMSIRGMTDNREFKKLKERIDYE